MRERAILQQVIEFHHFGAPMRLAGPESQAAENPRDVRRIILLQPVLLQRVSVDEPLQPKHPDYVGLSLLQSRKGRSDRLAYIDLLSVPARERRSQTVADLVQKG